MSHIYQLQMELASLIKNDPDKTLMIIHILMNTRPDLYLFGYLSVLFLGGGETYPISAHISLIASQSVAIFLNNHEGCIREKSEG